MYSIILFTLTFVFTVVLFTSFAPQFGKKPYGEHLKKLKKSPHYVDTHFENNPIADPLFSFLQHIRIISDIVRGKVDRQPKETLPSLQPVFDKKSGAYLTWFGHSTFLYEIDGKRILFDPMLGKHASPIPGIFSRYPYDLPSTAEDLPNLDIVIVTHDHYDHLDYETVGVLKNKVARFITPLGVGSHLLHWGVTKEKIIELDWWEQTTVGGITLTATPSQHYSGRAFTDRKKTLWAAWIIKSNTANVFFGGDSGYFPGFKTIGEKYGPFDLTLLDSGQYNTQWKEVHMLPEQSIVAHKELRGKVFMPIHWSAFTLALHGWTEPAERTLAEAKKEGIDMITPIIGQRFDVLSDRPKELWWRDY